MIDRLLGLLLLDHHLWWGRHLLELLLDHLDLFGWIALKHLLDLLNLLLCHGWNALERLLGHWCRTLDILSLWYSFWRLLKRELL